MYANKTRITRISISIRKNNFKEKKYINYIIKYNKKEYTFEKNIIKNNFLKIKIIILNSDSKF